MVGMRIWLATVFCLGLLRLTGQTTPPGVTTPGVSAFVDVSRFQDLDGGTYAEVYIAIDGRTVPFDKDAEGRYIGKVLVTMQVIREDSQTVYADKFRLFSLPLADTADDGARFRSFPIQLKRFRLKPGQHRMLVQFRSESPQAKSLPVTVDLTELSIPSVDTAQPSFSDVTFMERIRPITAANANTPKEFVRANVEMVPFVRNGSFIERDTMRFYFELYRSNHLKEQPYYVTVGIQPSNTTGKLSRYSRDYKVRMGKDVEVYNGSLDIRDLPSDTYYFVVEARTNNGTLLLSHRRKFFCYNSRSYSQLTLKSVDEYDRLYGYPEAELADYVKSLVFIASEPETKFLKALKTYDEYKNYFINFWRKRKDEPSITNPVTWPDYHKRVLYANQTFKTAGRKGWTTDRGRVMLVYGPPDDIQEYSYEQEMYPYQIWSYNSLQGQTGVIFVFYDPGLSANLYPLIHSTRRGEPFNNGWRNQINKSRGTRSPDYLMDSEQRGSPFQYYDDKITPGVSSGTPR
jgi:GWxTD domain-containing protein